MQEYITEMKLIHKNILDFVDSDEDLESKYEELGRVLNPTQIKKNKFGLIEILYIILCIANKHYRSYNFFDKIERMLLLLKEDIKNTFTNNEIYDFFQTNNRILLFLLQEKLLTIDKYVHEAIHRNILINNTPYLEINAFMPNENQARYYFSPELDPSEPPVCKDDFDADTFNQKRKNGENDNYICQLIRNDSVHEFIKYVNESEIDIFSLLDRSFFETNLALNLMDVTMIQYAAYFGSIKIFQYLLNKKAKIDDDIWFFAIHGRNRRLIHLIEERLDIQSDLVLQYPFISAEHHHNELTDYFFNYTNFTFPKGDFKTESHIYSLIGSLFYNYDYLTEEGVSYLSLEDFDILRNPLFFQVFLKSRNINVNDKINGVLSLIILIIHSCVMHVKKEIENVLWFY